MSLILLIGPVLSGCIHTYPDGDGVDPTLVQVGTEISIDVSWDTENIILTKSNNYDYRLILEFSRNGYPIGRCQHYLSQQDIDNGNVRLIMPFDFHAVKYKVTAWLDCVESVTHSNPAYNTQDLSYISRYDSHICWSEEKICACNSSEFSLQKYKDLWGAKAVIPIKLTTPLGRFKIIATDINEFRQYISKFVENGETYTVCLSFQSRIPSVFNLEKALTSNYLESPEYFFEFPDSESEIISAALLVGENDIHATARVLVYNSARVIVSKSPTIQFNIESGKITVLKGKMLTDFYNNSINVNNIWDGEIIIEIQ